MARHSRNGHTAKLRTVRTPTGKILVPGQVRMVRGLKIENVRKDGVCIVMLGELDAVMELGIALSGEECRTLAEALEQHADDLEQNAPVDDPEDRAVCLAGNHVKGAHKLPAYADCPGNRRKESPDGERE